MADVHVDPIEYERAVAALVQAAGHEIMDWQVTHLDPVQGVDGTYVIDVTARFTLFGAEFLMLFECKRHASAVKREDVQVLKDKLRSTGAHKGVVVAPSGFQRGVLEYARTHRIACVRLVDGAAAGYSNTLLSEQPHDVQELLFERPDDDLPSAVGLA